MKKPELLAPAGSMDSFKAAIEAGCDAVYLAGNAFGARAFAKNFSNEEIVEVIRIAHLYGVRVYVTVNTLVYDDEVSSFMEYIDFLHAHFVDAVIMQDLGMMDLVHQTYPNLEIHASTQMHIHTLEGAQFAHRQGLKRVVIARETPLMEISKIKRECDIEIECFVHGALCVSYSGQCFMSSLNGGRSGNRGSCVQCCRKPYQIVLENEFGNQHVSLKSYPLSMKDLCTIEFIPQLIESGIDSFKIEGRMKSPGYVYLVTSLYRKAIDQYFDTGSISITKQDMSNLMVMFNRKFTKGFLFDDRDIVHVDRPNHMGVPVGKVVSYYQGKATILLSTSMVQGDGIRILNHKHDVGCILNYLYLNHLLVNKANVGDKIVIDISSPVEVGDIVLKTLDCRLNQEIEKKLSCMNRKVFLTGTLYVKKGKRVRLTLNDSIHSVSVYSDFIVEEAKTTSVTFDRMKEQCMKLGDTIYSLSDFSVVGDTDIFIPISVLNDLRRKAVHEMNQIRDYKIPYLKSSYHREVPTLPIVSEKRIFVHNLNQYQFCKNLDASLITDDLGLYQSIPGLIYQLPRVMHTYPSIDSVMVGEVGCLDYYSSFITDFSLNVTNSYTVAFLHSMGAYCVTLSYELSNFQISYLIECYQKRYHTHPCLEVFVYGYREAMIMKYPICSSHASENKKIFLKDDDGRMYRVQRRDYCTILYHHELLTCENFSDYFDMGISYVRFDLQFCSNLDKFQSMFF